MPEERITTPTEQEQDQKIDISLRPKKLDDFVLSTNYGGEDLCEVVEISH